MTTIEKIEEVLRAGLTKNTFGNYELLVPEIKEVLKFDELDSLIETSKKIVVLINEDNSRIDLETAELIEMV